MKTYKVWIEIEEYDDITQTGETLDAPGAYIAEFETYEQAYTFAERLDALRYHAHSDAEWRNSKPINS